MKSKRSVVVTYDLTLSEEEAAWVRRLVQNPSNFDSELGEVEEDTHMRSKLWIALEEPGKTPTEVQP